jgi:hypothetical protein
MSSAKEHPGSEESSYEPPRLTAIGNLHDLLAGGGSLGCDAGVFEPGPLPFNDPTCTGG